MLVGETLCRICIVLLGYVYPAYQSYKAVNLGSPELLRQWCIYWLVLGSFLSVEWLADLTVFWLPLYYEAKLAFIVLCWHPRTRGAVYLFDRVIKPLLGRHEARIDSFVEESKTRAVDALTSQVNRVKGYLHGNTSVILEGLRQFSEQDAGPVPVSTHPLDEPGWPAADGLKKD